MTRFTKFSLRQRHVLRLGLLAFLFIGLAGHSIAQSAGNTITYQGQLMLEGSPAEGSTDMVFRLYDAQSGGEQIGSTLTRNGVNVSSGLFSVSLNFGSGAFDGSQRWLEIEVEGAALSPRQAVSATPYALFALDAPTPVLPSGGIDHSAPADNFRHIIDDDLVPADIAMTIGADGNPFIAASVGLHDDDVDDELHLIHCRTPDCSSYGSEVIDVRALSLSAMILPDGNPGVSYFPDAIGPSGFTGVGTSVRYIRCNSIDCSDREGATTVANSLEQGGSIGKVDMTLHGDGFPVFVYTDGWQSDNRVVTRWCRDLECSTADSLEVEISDTFDINAQLASITLQGDNRVAVAYMPEDGVINLAICRDGDGCDTTAVDNNVVGSEVAVTTSTTGFSALALWRDDGVHQMRLLLCRNFDCSGQWTRTMGDLSGLIDPEFGVDIAVGADGTATPVFLPNDSGQDMAIYVGTCGGARCQDNDIFPLTEAGIPFLTLFEKGVVATGADGNLVFATQRAVSFDDPVLEIIKTGNPLGQPYFRR